LALKNNTRSIGNMSATSVAGSEAYGISKLRLLVNLYADEGQDVDDLSGVPRGYNMGALLLPLKPGGMSVFEEATTLTATNADAKMGRNLEASSSMSLVKLDAQADQIVSLAGSGTLSLTVANAGLSSAVSAVASGSLTISANASLGGIIPVDASSAMSLSDNVTMTALAFMIAEAGGPTELSPEGLANAVWDTVLADHVDAGTTGAALSDAGGAGNPWSADLSTNNTPGTFGAFVQKLLSVAKFLGLK
jgi:hypothetical protein